MDYRNQVLARVVPAQLKQSIRRTQRRMQLRKGASAADYACPVCAYTGPFLAADDDPIREAAICPDCGAQERHRLQKLVLEALFANSDSSFESVLHFAPEPSIQPELDKWFERYETADLFDETQSHVVDISSMQFDDASFDCVYASHVLEHVQQDERAVLEIHRVLRPGGLAILPVPIMCDRTVEYPEPSPTEFYHVRAPGVDYFDRYRTVFDKVDIFSSSDFDDRYQLHTIEDRTVFPTATAPLREPQEGAHHQDYVPVCWKAGP